jgi:ankyrin repeat protein
MKNTKNRICLISILVAGFVNHDSFSAELSVGREFPYPSSYTAPQVQVATGGSGGSGVAIVGPSPSGFTTREIGTQLSVNTTIGAQVRVDYQNTELMLSSATGDLMRVQTLLQRTNVDVNAKNQIGSTALMGAAEGGHLDIIKILIEKGADLRAVNKDGFSALIFAARSGRDDVVQALLEKGADVNQADQYHQTVLMHALAEGHSSVAKLLIEKGADVNARSSRGATARTVANSKGNQELMTLLTQAGAAAQ